jgi:eukaryotic-like serine/threonine-protein kinase
MGRDRWARIERLYHEALARAASERAAFLAEACAGDTELRRDVESLLAQESSAELALTGGAVVAAAGLVNESPRSVLEGQRLGAYHILAPLGAGGMGEVYLARDTRLGREVAIKILPRAFTADADRVARFEREARVLASLDHPHIAAIHGIEDTPTEAGPPVRALILELIAGDTLAERIARAGMKGLPIREALDIGRQIADALDAAHQKGIVHRDLKPANIKITPQGAVKVLDFGLAKLEATTPNRADDPTQFPTLTGNDTREGVIVGTAAYMSPEQARGQAVDKRTDIWAFGCVLYEMLTGRTTFGRKTSTDTLAAILEHDADWTALPPATPPSVSRLIRRCLYKDLNRRLHDVADARIELDDAIDAPQIGNTAGETSPRARRVTVGSVILAELFGAVLSGAIVFLSFNRPIATTTPRSMQFVATGGDAHGLEPSGLDCDIAVSPDGQQLAYVAGGPGRIQLVTRSLAQLNSTVLWDRGTPRSPFFSPDGEWIGFFELFGALRKISATGGPAIQVSRAVGGAARGGTWSPDGSIIFATSNPQTGLWRVPAGGGEPKVLTRPVTAEGELDHFWPEMLPGGNAVLFTIVPVGTSNRAQIAVLDLKTGRSKVLIRGGTHARYVSSGHLLYGSAGSQLLFREDDPSTGLDVDLFEVAAQKAAPYIRTAFNEMNAEVSPDGRWVAYQSNESGQEEIYVRSFGGTVGRWQLSTTGGTRPVWARSGRELFYLAPDGLNAVPVGDGASFSSGRPATLITHRYFATAAFLGRTYDVSPDGQRFVMIKQARESEGAAQVIVRANWLNTSVRTGSR